MTNIIHNFNDYKDGLSYIDDHKDAGWTGNITIENPCGVRNIQPNEPIIFFFSFREQEKRCSLNSSKPLKSSQWHVYAEIPFKAGLEKVTICRKAILDECEQKYYRNICFDDRLQKKHINDALKKAINAIEKFFSQKGKNFVPEEDFHRAIYYVDETQIDCPEKEIKLSDLKVYERSLIELIQDSLPKENSYKSKGCDIFFNGQLLGSYWSENEADYALMLLQKKHYSMDADYHHRYFDTLAEAENYRNNVYVACTIAPGYQTIRSIFNTISALRRGEKPTKKSKDTETAERMHLELATVEN